MNRDSYEHLVKFLHDGLHERVKYCEIGPVADSLNLLPVGVEVLLARKEWSIDDTISVADALDWKITFEAH